MSAPTTTDLPAPITADYLNQLRLQRCGAASKVARARDHALPGDPDLVAKEAALLEVLIIEHAAKQIVKFGPLRSEQADRIDAWIRSRVAS